jgi:hypothetical protein
MRFLLSGIRRFLEAQLQWAPKLNSHDPNPPITIENPAASEVTGTLAISTVAAMNASGARGESGSLAASATAAANLAGSRGETGTIAVAANAQVAASGTAEGPTISGSLTISASANLAADGDIVVVIAGGGAARRAPYAPYPPSTVKAKLEIELALPVVASRGESFAAFNAQGSVAVVLPRLDAQGTAENAEPPILRVLETAPRAAAVFGCGRIIAAARISGGGKHYVDHRDEEEILALLIPMDLAA